MRGPRKTVNKAAETERQWGGVRQEIARARRSLPVLHGDQTKRDADQWKRDERVRE